MDVYSAALGVFVKLLRDVLAAAVAQGAEACSTQALGPRIAATFPYSSSGAAASDVTGMRKRRQ
jgi:hypothetical protein